MIIEDEEVSAMTEDTISPCTHVWLCDGFGEFEMNPSWDAGTGTGRTDGYRCRYSHEELEDNGRSLLEWG